MEQGRGKKALMALVAIVPFVVISTILFKPEGVERVLSAGSGRRASDGEGRRQEGRRLQSTTYNFATQLEMTVCLTDDHTSDSATVTADQFKTAVVSYMSIENEELVNVDDAVTRCSIDGWQARVSIYNEADEADDQTAAEIASEQVDEIYIDPGPTAFFTGVVAAITAQDSELVPEATDYDLNSLGFLVIWLDDNGEVLSTQGTTSKSKDVVSIGGTDVWWPWWAWLIYAGVVLCCICPMLFFFFKWRRDKEAEEEGFGQGQLGPGKELGTPAPPSATSTNPYGGNYNAGEEYKTGQ